MKDCRETLARLQTFLDRELSDAEVQEVHIHLRDCPPCNEFFRFEEKLKRLVRLRACPEKAPDSLRVRISQSLRQP